MCVSVCTTYFRLFASICSFYSRFFGTHALCVRRSSSPFHLLLLLLLFFNIVLLLVHIVLLLVFLSCFPTPRHTLPISFAIFSSSICYLTIIKEYFYDVFHCIGLFVSISFFSFCFCFLVEFVLGYHKVACIEQRTFLFIPLALCVHFSKKNEKTRRLICIT